MADKHPPHDVLPPELRARSLIPPRKAPPPPVHSALDTVPQQTELQIPEAVPPDHEILAQKQRLFAKMFGVDAPPRRLGHYEILSELGRGGMGVVYAARDRKLGRKVALKLLQLQDSTLLRRRLLVEAQALAKLAHPNVVAIYEIGQLESATFIVMEYVQGVTLRAYVERDQRSISELLEVFRAAGTGLAAAHAAGMVHRDFKPDNVMVGDDGRVRVMDFGLARAEQGERAHVSRIPDFDISQLEVSDRLTPQGAVLGTPAYMAPEQLAGREADAKSDQFAFCVSLYQALYGRRPFAGATVKELREAIERGELPPAPRHSRVPSWLREILVQGLSAAPSERFASMSALLGAVERGLEQSTRDGREAPTYVFIVHADGDKLAVLQLCQALLDRGLRPWLDLWDLEQGEGPECDEERRREVLRAALLDAPAVLVCHGPHGWGAALHAEALRARVEAGHGSVYGLWLPDPLTDPLTQGQGRGQREPSILAVDAPRVRLGDDPVNAAAGLDTLAALIGADPQRRGWLSHELERTRAQAQSEELSPYRGLEVFRERDARWMFGRERESAELLELLGADEPRFLTVIGASGSGKSSLVLAGVCPALRNGAVGGRVWSVAKLRPGPSPCESLAHVLVDLQDPQLIVESGSRPGSSVDAVIEVEKLRQMLLDSTNTLKVFVDRFTAKARSSRPTTPRLLIVVDQLEELFSEGHLGEADAHSEAEAFVANLLGAARACPRLRIIATLRADFVQRCLEISELAQVLKLGAYFALPPMDEAQLRAAIIRPARRLGHDLDAELVERLVGAAAGHAGRLPLLQHVLRQLWARRERDTRRLPFSIYAETGGLERAIAVAAESTLSELCARLGPRAQLLTRGVMTRLVHLGEGERGHTRRRASATELGVDADLRVVLDAFIDDARVLIANELEGVEVFELAHEALLREWATLRDWLAADSEALSLRQELSADASKWAQRGGLEFLWGKARVSEAQRILAASTVELNANERRFLGESRRRASRRQRASALAAVLITSAAVLVAMALATKNRQIAGQSVSLSVKNHELARSNGELVTRERELAVALGSRLTMLASSLVAEDREDEVLTHVLDAHDAYRSLGSVPPVRARRQLAKVLADDAVVVRDAARFGDHLKGVSVLALAPKSEHFVSGGLDHRVLIWSPEQPSALHTLERHTDAIMSVTYDATGSRIVSASLDGTAIIWDATTGAQLQQLTSEHARLYDARFSPDGELVATAGNDGLVRLWSTQTGKLIAAMVGHEGPVRDLDFAPDGAHLVSAGYDGSVRIWDVHARSVAAVLRGHEDRVMQVAYAPDGAHIASASWDGSLRLWTARGDEHRVLARDGQLHVLSFSHNSGLVAAAGTEADIRVWDTATGELSTQLVGHRDDVFSLAFSPDDRLLASGSRDHSARVWALDSGVELGVYRRHTNTVRALAFDDSGAVIVTASYDGTLARWRTPSDRRLVNATGHTAGVYKLAFSPDGARIVTSGWDGRALVWSTQTGERLAVLRGPGAKLGSVSYSSDGALIFTTCEGQVQVWTGSGQLRRTLDAHAKEVLALRTGPGGAVVTAGWDHQAKIWDSAFARDPVVLEGHSKQVHDAAFSPTADRVATASFDHDARIWDQLTGASLHTLEGHEGYVYAVAYSHDGRRLATASADGSARIWDVERGLELARCHAGAEVQQLALSPDDQRLVTGNSAGQVQVFSVATGAPVDVLDAHTGTVNAVAYSLDGSLIASAGSDGILRLWDVSAQSSRAQINAHDEAITELIFSPDGSLIATASTNSEAKLWRASTGELAFPLRARVSLRNAGDSSSEDIPAQTLVELACARLQGAVDVEPHPRCDAARSQTISRGR